MSLKWSGGVISPTYNGLNSPVTQVEYLVVAGGGGAGNYGTNTSGSAGSVNTGGGGGGGSGGGTGNNANGNGGSGIVIIAYQSTTQRASGGTITTYGSGSGLYYVHTFTSSGTFTA